MHRRLAFISAVLSTLISSIAFAQSPQDAPTEESANRPFNIVLVMADDQGWGQVGYNGHPVLKTRNLDAMAAAGIRSNRFYAAGPVCSGTL